MQSTIRFYAVHLLCLTLCATAIGQQPVSQDSTALAVQTNITTIPKGSCGKACVEFFLLEAVSSATAKKGQAVRMEIAEDVSINGVVVIPKGTQAEGKVTSVRKGVAGKRDGHLEVEAKKLLLGNSQRLRLRQYPPGKDSCGEMPCWMLIPLIPLAAPLTVLAIPVAIVASPFLLANDIHEHRQSRPAGAQMVFYPCRRISAYLSTENTLKRTNLHPTAAPPAAAPLACETAN